MAGRWRSLIGGTLLAGAGLLTLAVLVAHAWINARAAHDFRCIGAPPFEYAWRGGLLQVVGSRPEPSSTRVAGGDAARSLLSPPVRPGDQIARIAGLPVHDVPRWRHHWLWRLNGRPLRRGQLLPLTVVRGGVAREVVVTLDGIPSTLVAQVGRAQAMLLLKHAAGFGLWLLGVLVLTRRRDPVTRLFFLWCLALALYTAGSVIAAPLWDSYPSAPIRFFRTGFMAGWFLAPALFGHFCWTFVNTLPAERWRRMLPGLFYALPLVALGISQAGFLALPGSATDQHAFAWLRRLLWQALAAGWLATLGLGFATLFRAYGGSTDARWRRQIALVLAGSLAYAAVFLHAFITVLNRWDAHPGGAWAWLPYVLLPVTPLAFAYAILRHDLLDLRLVIRRSLVFALLTLCMAGVFIVLQHLAGVALQARTGATSLSAQTLAALAVAALFGPTERRIARLVETLFNRAHGRRLELLRELGQQIDLPAGGAPLEGVLTERVAAIVEVESAALYWLCGGSAVLVAGVPEGRPKLAQAFMPGKREPVSPSPGGTADGPPGLLTPRLDALDASAGQFRLAAAHGSTLPGEPPPAFRKNGSLAAWLAAAGAPLEFAALPREERIRCLTPEEREQLDAMGIALCIPMIARGALAGFLLLGPKSDTERFSPPEREALLTLASLAARALQQAELTRRIRELEQERDTLLGQLHRQERRQQNARPVLR